MASAAPDHFALFGLEPRFAIDLDRLDRAYKRVQAQVHPDRFASASDAEKRVAMQWAARANEAFQTLRLPARRAAYLCEANGAALNVASNTAMPPAFLTQQLEWREALDEAALGGDAARIEAVARQADQAHVELLAAIGHAIDGEHDYAHAATLVRQLLFIDKLREEIGTAQHAREEAA